MTSTATLAPTVPLDARAPRSLRRLLTTLVVGLVAILVAPGTAFATTEPVISGSGTVAGPKPVAPAASAASDASSTGSTLGAILAYALVAALAVAVVIVARRITRDRRTAKPSPLTV